MAAVHPFPNPHPQCLSPTVVTRSSIAKRYYTSQSSYVEPAPPKPRPPPIAHPFGNILEALFDKTNVMSVVELAKFNLLSRHIRILAINNEKIWSRLFQRDFSLNYTRQFVGVRKGFRDIYKSCYLSRKLQPLCTVIKIIFDKTTFISFIEVVKLNFLNREIRTLTANEKFWCRLFKRDYPINYENYAVQFGFLYEGFQQIYKECYLLNKKIKLLHLYDIVKHCLIRMPTSLLNLYDNKIVVAHDTLGIIDIWEIKFNRSPRKVDSYQLQTLTYRCFYINNEIMIFPGKRGHLFVYNRKTHKCEQAFDGHLNSTVLKIDLIGKYVVSVSSNDVFLWNIKTLHIRLWFKTDHSPITSFTHRGELDDGRGLFAIGTAGGTIILHDFVLANQIGDQHRLKGADLVGHRGAVNSLVLCFEDKLLSGGDDNIIQLWDLTTLKSIRIWNFHLAPIKKLVVSDGMICSLDKDGDLLISEFRKSDFNIMSQRGINVGYDPCDVRVLGHNIIIASGTEVSLLTLKAKRPLNSNHRVRRVKCAKQSKNIYICLMVIAVLTIIVVSIAIKT